MENGNFLEKMASQFGQNASVKNVYGEPVRAGEKIIIPVARIAYGLGGGYGQVAACSALDGRDGISVWIARGIEQRGPGVTFAGDPDLQLRLGVRGPVTAGDGRAVPPVVPAS